nr:Chain A, RNA polymerase alpha subunit [Sendai virus (strain Harris)]
KPTMHSLRLVIESSPLSRAEKAAYVKSLSKCKTDQEVKAVMELVEEDIESLTN